MNNDEELSILKKFIQFPLNNEKEIVEMFTSLPGAIHKKGKHPREEFVFIRGTRADRVTLVAHCDTVFGLKAEHKIAIKDGKIISEEGDCGIGADDRAGCAMLWLLRDSGHNILICNGEEPGNEKGSYFLINKHPKIAKEIQESSFMLSFDRRNANNFITYRIPVSDDFKAYLGTEVGLTEDTTGGWTDIVALSSQTIAKDCCCAANISVGYYDAHKYFDLHGKSEYLIIEEWLNAYHKYKAFLEKPQKRFVNVEKMEI